MERILRTSSSPNKRRVKRNINELVAGDYFKGNVKILRKVKPGPLILSVFDGTGTIDAIAHDRIFEQIEDLSDKPSVYNFGNVQIKDNRKKTSSPEDSSSNRNLSIAEINVDNVVKIFGKVVKHRDRIEIEIKNIRESTLDFNDIINTQSLPARDTFSIESERYESMKSRFTNIAQRVRRAIIEEQPILLRHHNDADGICAGLVMERAIRSVMNRRDLSTKHRIYRSPSISPFYDEIDLFRDISKFNRYSEEFGDKSPLILLLDTGSTPENLFALEVLHGFNIECIIVDHHNPGPVQDGKSQVCDFLQFHLNPYLFGWDSQTCGGMLCYELARFIDEELDMPDYPAVAAVGDRCDIPEVDRLIENTGKPKEDLVRMAMVIDYLAFNFRFDGGDGVYDKVFTKPSIVDIIGSHVEEKFDATLKRILPTVKSEEINGVFYSEIDLQTYTQRGKYPPPGKTLGVVHDYLAQSHANMPVFTGGYFSDGVIIRATEPVLPVPTLLTDLQSTIPEANVDGGGHEQAGSLKYISAFDEQIRNFIKQELHEVIHSDN